MVFHPLMELHSGVLILEACFRGRRIQTGALFRWGVPVASAICRDPFWGYARLHGEKLFIHQPQIRLLEIRVRFEVGAVSVTQTSPTSTSHPLRGLGFRVWGLGLSLGKYSSLTQSQLKLSRFNLGPSVWG